MREVNLMEPVVALSLYKLLDKKTGLIKYDSRDQLCADFKVSPTSRIVLSGTHTDPSLERVWGIEDRMQFFRSLADLDIALVTTPNFSLFCDNPRVDDLHSIKRIGIVQSELLRAGVQSALHVNGRTEKDYSRWAEFLEARPEIEWICFEFGTGAGRPNRIEYHSRQLAAVASFVTRPLNLIVRGGMSALTGLRNSFQQLSFIDTTAFVKTHNRQLGLYSDRRIAWEKIETEKGQPLDSQLSHNIQAMKSYVEDLLH
jgi:hypothetical protein